MFHRLASTEQTGTVRRQAAGDILGPLRALTACDRAFLDGRAARRDAALPVVGHAACPRTARAMSRMGRRRGAVRGSLKLRQCRDPQMTATAETDLLVEDMGAGTPRGGPTDAKPVESPLKQHPRQILDAYSLS